MGRMSRRFEAKLIRKADDRFSHANLKDLAFAIAQEAIHAEKDHRCGESSIILTSISGRLMILHDSMWKGGEYADLDDSLPDAMTEEEKRLDEREYGDE